jgi:mannose-6-phosphate isomerase
MACYRLRNPVQHYAWGSRTVLPELLGAPSPSAEPWAELWIGAHARAPSEVEIGGAWRSLRGWIEERPVPVLGQRVAARFGAQLPFLLKLIAAEQPLSLQAHPDAARAAQGFADEECAGIPRDAPQRRYADPNPKPELVCALAPFEALCGFREVADVRAAARALGARGFQAVVDAAPEAARPGDLLAALLRLPAAERRRVAAELAERAAADASRDPALAWLLRLHDRNPGDVACAAPLLLHSVRLAPGEAMFLRPGELHSYLRGSAIEIMACSDNVVRAGLTPKHVDVEELLRVLRAGASPPLAVAAAPGGPGEEVYAPPTEWFRLATLRARAGAPLPVEVSRGAEVLLCLEGAGELAAADAAGALPFARGEALFVAGETPRYELRGEATLVRASAG